VRDDSGKVVPFPSPPPRGTQERNEELHTSDVARRKGKKNCTYTANICETLQIASCAETRHKMGLETHCRHKFVRPIVCRQLRPRPLLRRSTAPEIAPPAREIRQYGRRNMLNISRGALMRSTEDSRQEIRRNMRDHEARSQLRLPNMSEEAAGSTPFRGRGEELMTTTATSSLMGSSY